MQSWRRRGGGGWGGGVARPETEQTDGRAFRDRKTEQNGRQMVKQWSKGFKMVKQQSTTRSRTEARRAPVEPKRRPETPVKTDRTAAKLRNAGRMLFKYWSNSKLVK